MRPDWFVYLENPPAHIPNQMPIFVFHLLETLGFFRGLFQRIGYCNNCGMMLVRFASSEQMLGMYTGLPENGTCLNPHCLDANYPGRHDCMVDISDVDMDIPA